MMVLLTVGNLKKWYREPIKALNILVPGIAHYFQGWSPKIQDPALKLPDVPYAIERQSGNAVKLVHLREKESVRSPWK